MQNNIQQAEAKWVKTLYQYCRNTFSSCHIPSHDESHHLRVWHICKEALLEFNKKGESFSYDVIEALIFAVFFHDTGLTVNKGENHGLESKQIFLSFLEKNQIKFKLQYEVAQAIEYHDDKSYKNEYTKQSPYSIFNILCICDDLDAFAYTGIYRYIEIYLMRNCTIEKLADQVLRNLNKRLKNFEHQYRNHEAFFSRFYNKYIITRDFFELLKKETKNNNYKKTGKVVQLIQKQVVINQQSVFDIEKAIPLSDYDEYVQNYFNKLLRENKAQNM